MPPPSTTAVIQAVRRASEQSAAVVHEHMKQGLNSLATIASIAPLAGLFGTVWGILNSFVSCGGEKSACLGVIGERLSGSMWATALGLLVGLTSLWCYRYLTGRLEAFDHEMENAYLELLNRLIVYRERFKPGLAITRVRDTFLFAEKSPAELRQDRKSWRRSIFLTCATLVVAWSVQVVRYFEHDFFPLGPATRTACVYVLFTFCVSCLPAHPLWVRLLHRRPGGLPVVGSLICFCWSVAELVLRVHLL
ncbi:MAG TPA: MotA/TolQ/ExbB proton channel family protein [Candidatus Acidoferrales bacterium]|nr:MotA/TolQ/ExbB proton channel family protein [Candidatus Acidoferrales bacterium]